ncbi:MAG: aminodeoxychorismate lyase [Proteobacteria bacterium]|nr:aminodeoxychorismate lyase [Pseudomonadota bacterium]
MARRKTNKSTGSTFGRVLGILILLAVLAVGAVGAWFYGYANRPLATAVPADFVLEPGSFNKAVEQLQKQGIIDDPQQFMLLGRLLRAERRIKAGSYEISEPTSPWQLLEKLTAGDTSMVSVKIIEGWSWRQLKASLAGNPDLKHDAVALSDADLVAALQLPVSSVEGQFFPDTYYISKGSSELQLLKRAHRLMTKKLETAWALRLSGLPLKDPQEALTLASLVEKETGQPSDRPMIAGVFINRLRLGMRLQTDPSVIYGLGERFDGNLRRADLENDTPWNTYTRSGLTPTPIAFVGEAALKAALQPAQTSALYFVARGDGSSQFSDSLDAHNAAVRRFQLHR